MAHYFSDKDGNLGTMVVLKGQPQDYLDPAEHEYHGDLELPGTYQRREALIHRNGKIIEDRAKLTELKIKEAKERHDKLRAEIREELHEASLDGASSSDIADIRAKADDLKYHRDLVIGALEGNTFLAGTRLIEHDKFDHSEHGLAARFVDPAANANVRT